MTAHVPILVEPIVEALLEPFKRLPAEAPAHWLIDGTFGGGGHTAAFLEVLKNNPALKRHKILALDQDPAAVARGRERFGREIEEGRLHIVHGRFSDAGRFFDDRPILGLMADLGFSSDQLEDPARGLSFQSEGPLDMRLDPTQGRSARDFLARTSERELEGILSELGEERYSRRIASAIIQARSKAGVPKTTQQLTELILRAVPPPARHGRIHAATRTFQALRILVNGELDELDSLLERVILSVRPGGRVAILSFHSLEDRKVKHAFREKDGAFVALTKKPVEADDSEIQRNPRARSAKLRIAERGRQ